VLRTSLEWRSEINRIARERKQVVNKMLLAIIGAELQLGERAEERRKESVTSKIARTWILPDSPGYAEVRAAERAEAKRRRAERAQGAPAGAGAEGEPSTPREDAGAGAERQPTGPNSGDAP